MRTTARRTRIPTRICTRIRKTEAPGAGAPPLPWVPTDARRPSGKFGSGGKPSVAHAAAGVGNAPSCEQPKTLATTG